MEWQTARLTGYYPRDAHTPRQVSEEGPDHDQNSQPLHYAENYNEYDQRSFIGLAADDRTFKYNDPIIIKEFPGVRFLIRDNGGGFNGKKGLHAFDMPFLTRKMAHQVIYQKTGGTDQIHWKRGNYIEAESSTPLVAVTDKSFRNTDDNSLLWIVLAAVALLG